MTDEENTKRELVDTVHQFDHNPAEVPAPEHTDFLSALRIKLYYVLNSKRADMWEDFQRKALNGTEDETVLRWARKPLQEITFDDQQEIALEAFYAAMQGRDQPVMSDIVQSAGSGLDLQTKDVVELVDKDYYSVIKAIIQKPLVVSKKLKRDFQCPKYHRAERILNILGVESKDEFLQLGDIVDYMMDNKMSDDKLEKLLAFFADSEDKSSLRSLLIHEKEKIAERFYREGKIKTNDFIMVVALEYKSYNFLLLYMKVNNYELSDESVATPLFSKLVKLFLEDLSRIELYLYIMRKYVEYMPYASAKVFVEAINDWLRSQKLRIPFVYAVVNPVKICVLLIEVLHQIKEKNDSLEKWTENLISDITRLASLLINEIHDDGELNEIFMDHDLDGRPTIQIAAAHEILALFKHKSISSVTEKLWSGPYVAKEHPFAGTSLLLTNLVHSPSSRIDMFYRSLPKLFSRDYLSYPTHNFQYVTWRDGLQSRYALEALFYVFLFIYTYYLVATVTYYGRAAYGIINERKTSGVSLSLSDTTNIGQNFKDMTDVLVTIKTYLLLLFIVNFRHVFLGIFAVITGRSMKPMHVELTLDSLLNLCIAMYYFYVRNDFNTVLEYRSNVYVFNSKMVEFWDGNSWVVPLLALMLVIIFVRTLNLLEVHTVIGPFIEMIKQMFLKLGTFSLLFVVLLFFFSMVAALYLPYSLVEHRSIYRSLISLFQTSIGVFDINLMNTEMKAEIFTFIFVIVFNILLLNLLIAILTQVYTTISVEADTLYVNDLVVLHQLYAPQDEYSSIITLFPPLNFVFGIICLPILLAIPSRSRREAINTFFLKVEYTLAFVIVMAGFLAAEALFFVLCYIKVTIHLFVLIFIGWEHGAPRRVGGFILFLLFGPVLMLPVLFSDLYYFTLHAYLSPGERRFTDETREPMHKRVLVKLKKFVNDVKQKYVTVAWEHLRKTLYDLCSIDILSQASPRGEESVRNAATAAAATGMLARGRTKSKYRNYKNFTIASQILKLNSTLEDDEIMVDLETLSNILENYLFIARLQKRQSVLIKKEVNEIMRKRSLGHTMELPVSAPAAAASNNNSMMASDRSGAALISIRADNNMSLMEPDMEPEGRQHILMKLCMSYSIDRYTNALIAFKDLISSHWLAKNSLLMAQDIKATKRDVMVKTDTKTTANFGAIAWEEKKPEKKRRISEPGSREDSLIGGGSTGGRGSEGKNSNLSFTMQELDDILKGVEAEGDITILNDNRKNELLILPQQTISKSPSRSLLVGEVPPNLKFGQTST